MSTRDDTIRALEERVRELECRDASLTAAREAAETGDRRARVRRTRLAREVTRDGLVKREAARPESSDAWSFAARDVLRERNERRRL